jgi:hypothetical protein
MANYTASEILTRAVAVSATMNAGIQKGELRGNLNGALDCIIKNTPELIVGGAATIATLKTRPDHSIKIPVLKRSTRTVGSTRNCATSTTADDTALVTPSFTTVTDGGFQVNLSAADGNMYNIEQQLANSMKQSFRILHEKLALDTLTFLETNKATSAGQVGTLMTWNALNGQQQNTLANRDNFFGYAYEEMRQNKYSGPYDVIHTFGDLGFQIARQANQGAGNSTNLAWQLGQGFNFFGEQQFTGASGTTGSAYIMEAGTIGMINWNRPDFRTGGNLGDMEVWATIPDPIYPEISWELKIKRSCGDGNTYNTGGVGYENSQLASFLISADFSRLARYTSTAGDTGVMKYAQMSA